MKRNIWAAITFLAICATSIAAPEDALHAQQAHNKMLAAKLKEACLAKPECKADMEARALKRAQKRGEKLQAKLEAIQGSGNAPSH